MNNPTYYQGDEPSVSALRQQDQAIHSVDGQIVETQVELYKRQLGLNAKRPHLNNKQLQPNAELLELYKKQLKLNGEQPKLTVQTNVSIVLQLMLFENANTPTIPAVVTSHAATIPVINYPTAAVYITTKKVLPFPPIASLSLHFLQAVAQKGKCRAHIVRHQSHHRL